MAGTQSLKWPEEDTQTKTNTVFEWRQGLKTGTLETFPYSSLFHTDTPAVHPLVTETTSYLYMTATQLTANALKC